MVQVVDCRFFRRHLVCVPDGLSLAEIVASVQPDHVRWPYTEVVISGHMIHRAAWPRVRPKSNAIVYLVFVPRGRSPGAAMAGSITSMVLLLGGSVLAATPLAPVGWGMIAAGIGTGLATQFLLTPRPKEETSTIGRPQTEIAVRNQSGYGRQIPSLLGRRNWAPVYAAEPYTESSGGDVFYRAIFTLSEGIVTDPVISIGRAPIENYRDVDYEFRRGWHQNDITERGAWYPADGWPSSATPGDHYTIAAAGVIDGWSVTAGQTITYNGLAPADSVAGWDVDVFAPIGTYPAAVLSDVIGAEVHSRVEWIERRTAPDTVEALIDIVWPRGLVHYEKSGGRKARTVEFALRYRPVGQDVWTNITFRVRANRAAQFTSTQRITFPFTGQYDIAIRRVSPHQSDDRNIEDSTWGALRSVIDGAPVPVGGISYLAIRIRGSGQLTVLDELRVQCQRVGWDWADGQWRWGPISTLAGALRAVIQSRLWRGRVEDSDIDLPALAEWAEWCAAEGVEYHALVTSGTVSTVIETIMRVGRARLVFSGGVVSVAVDRPTGAATMLIGPANSSGAVSTYTYPRLPDAYRVSYVDHDADEAEVVVYVPGQTPATARNIERVQMPGVATARQAVWLARAEMSDRWLRRERHEVSISYVAGLTLRVGDRVDYASDTIAVGLAYGRIAAVVLVGGIVSEVEVDTDIAGSDYRLMISVDRGGTVIKTGCERIGQRRVRISSPSSLFAPLVGDVVTIGTVSSAVVECIVDSIAPQGEAQIKVGMIAAAAARHEWTDNLPVWDAHTIALPTVPAVRVIDIYSGSRVLERRTLAPRIVISHHDLGIAGARVVASIRPADTNLPWAAADVVATAATSIMIGGVIAGEEYEISLVAVADAHISSPPAVVRHMVTGELDRPADLTGVMIASVGGQALLQWDDPIDIDVIDGGWVEIRHTVSNEPPGAWGSSVEIGTVSGGITYAYVPMMQGWYLVRVFDAGGRPSAGFTAVRSDDASVLEYVSVGELRADPTFAGALEGLTVVDGTLRLSAGTFDAITAPDDIINPDAAGGGVLLTTGVYTFGPALGWATVQRVRLTAEIDMLVINLSVMWDDILIPIDDWLDIDQVEGAPATAEMQIRTTTDDPGGSPTWSDWSRVMNRDVHARGVQARLIARTDTDEYNLMITRLALHARVVQ